MKYEFIIVFGFIGFDFLTGFISRIYNNDYKSTIARQGLYHKIGEILCICFAIFCDFAQTKIDLGFEIPFTIAIIIYICLMECGSICENIIKINPELSNPLSKIFGGNNND